MLIKLNLFLFRDRRLSVSKMSIYIVQAETNNNRDLSTHEEFRYSPTILGVFQDIKEAESTAEKYCSDAVETINKDKLENDNEGDEEISQKRADKLYSGEDKTQIYRWLEKIGRNKRN